MSKMTSKERLEQYVDVFYQDYLDNHKSYVSDFDRFCIEHCQDIRNILEENERLKRQQKEFVRYLEEEKERCLVFYNYTACAYAYDVFKNVLSKYKEIIGGIEDESNL